uniref:Plectin n=1 Tax=Drosophila rhopaloa TaxID=1041015 RepID=A0A6P4FQL7_DRORH
MDVVEFLSRTDRRNLKSQIGFQVARKMREWYEDVDNRRWNLSLLLQKEALQADEKIAEMLQEQADEADRRRHEWIEMERLDENSEAHRHMQTKEILLESKQAQLHQIEEKKALKRRQACVEILWQRVWQRLDESKAQQEQYELKLRNLIEGRCQAQNLEIDRKLKAQFAKEVLAEQRECSQALEIATEMDVLKKQHDLKKVKDKRRQQLTDLQDQIKQNRMTSVQQMQAKIREDTGHNILEDRQIYEELMEKRCARTHNRDWHQRYMTHTAEERAARKEEDDRRERSYLGTGCVLRQQQKQPYGRAVR